MITADTLRQSETNILRLPKTTVEEQMTNTALNLSQPMRHKSEFCLPNTTLRGSIHNLASMFQQGVDKIAQDEITSTNFNYSCTRVDKVFPNRNKNDYFSKGK